MRKLAGDPLSPCSVAFLSQVAWLFVVQLHVSDTSHLIASKDKGVTTAPLYEVLLLCPAPAWPASALLLKWCAISQIISLLRPTNDNAVSLAHDYALLLIL